MFVIHNRATRYFGITVLQAEDTLSFAITRFSEREEKGLQKNFRAKPKSTLEEGVPIDFNGGRIQLHGSKLTLRMRMHVVIQMNLL
jgi:hypothetical protein